MADLTGAWLADLERRHLAELTFPEVRRSLQALSSLYVARRRRIADGVALDGRGKRAAFALYYGPLHFTFVREVVRALGIAAPPPRRIVDLGCGTGVASAAWALEADGRPRLEGIDLNGWALDEARRTWAVLGLEGRTRREDASRPGPLGSADAVAAAFAVNEMPPEARDALRSELLSGPASVLVVEPIAKGPVPWWGPWANAFREAGGREDTWRFRVVLPDIVVRLDRAAGLDHRELTGRTLWRAAAGPRFR